MILLKGYSPGRVEIHHKMVIKSVFPGYRLTGAGFLMIFIFRKISQGPESQPRGIPVNRSSCPIYGMKTIMMELRLIEVFFHLDPGGEPEGPMGPAGIEYHVGIEFSAHMGFLEKIHNQEKLFIPESLHTSIQLRIDKENLVLIKINIGLNIAVSLKKRFKIAASC
jgi:hypothetical protein